MKFYEKDRFDGLDEKHSIYATAEYDDDDAGGDGIDDNDLFGDIDEEEEVVVSMALDDEGSLSLLQEATDELLESGPHAEEAVIKAAPSSPASGYTPATAMSKAPVKSAASAAAPVAKKAKKAAPAKKAPAKKAVAKKAPAKKTAVKKTAAKKAAVKKTPAKRSLPSRR